MNFCILASGSSGNCSIIWTDKTAALIDFGCSSKYLTDNLHILGILPQNLNIVMITHAHIDHISASGLNFIAKNNIPIYTHEDIFKDILKKYENKIKKCKKIPFLKNFSFKDLIVEFFDVHHKDANISKTIGFTLRCFLNKKEYKIGYVTDTGMICKEIINSLTNSNILVIESNYNRMMLDSSFRTYNNKKWILSNYGHLSNEDAADAICKIKKQSSKEDSLKYVFLAHLSQQHNTRDLALKTVSQIFLKNNIKNIKLLIAERNHKSPVIRITAN
ncbi:MAG: MBL fold metallo-hydrolase [Endomicrobium sp.]|nr:MBL fold metallo-hydrolase [Endomicrobium sp.]